MDRDDIILGACTLVLCFLVILALLILFYSPVREADHYKRLTGVEVSYWDAFFLDLDPSKHVILVDDNSKK